MARDTEKDSRLGKLLDLLCDQIAPEGLAVVRTHKRSNVLDSYADLHVIDRRQWGSMAVAILQKQTAGSTDNIGDQERADE